MKKHKVKSAAIFDIVSHKHFLKEVDGATGTDMVALILANINLFSFKQKRWLKSPAFELYKKYAPMTILDSDESEGEAPISAREEALLATAKAFVFKNEGLPTA